MATVNKEGIVRRFNDKMGEGLAKSNHIIDALVDTLKDIMKEGHDVRIQGFGVFKLKRKPERTIIVPSTKESKVIAEHTSVSFHASQKMKDEVTDIRISAV